MSKPNRIRELSDEIASLSKKAATQIVALGGRRGGLATGLAWSDGSVVAANHTLEWDEGVDVTLVDGSSGRADVIGRDPTTDVALLRVSGLEVPDPQWEISEAEEPGALALVVAATSLGPRVELTNLAVVGEAFTGRAGGRIDRYLESAASIFLGFSGSALLDAEGRLIGMNTTGLARRRSLAIPHETLTRVVAELREHGSVRRGYLGVTTYPIRLPDSATQRVGLLISSVQPQSPADKAGLFLGDVLLAFDGEPLGSASELMARLSEDRIGRATPVTILRTGETKTLSVAVEARP